MAKALEVDNELLEKILNHVNGLQYGQVVITVHDGRIVQIDRTEKTRFDHGSSQKRPAVDAPKQESVREKGTSSQDGESLRAVQ